MLTIVSALKQRVKYKMGFSLAIEICAESHLGITKATMSKDWVRNYIADGRKEQVGDRVELRKSELASAGASRLFQAIANQMVADCREINREHTTWCLNCAYI